MDRAGRIMLLKSLRERHGLSMRAKLATRDRRALDLYNRLNVAVEIV
jgi:hypothetical protein